MADVNGPWNDFAPSQSQPQLQTNTTAVAPTTEQGPWNDFAPQQSAISQTAPQQQTTQQPQFKNLTNTPQPSLNPIPQTASALAGVAQGIQGAAIQLGQGVINTGIGLGENALTAVTGAIATPIADVAGLTLGAGQNALQNYGQAAGWSAEQMKNVNDWISSTNPSEIAGGIKQALTYQPQTSTGQLVQQGLNVATIPLQIAGGIAGGLTQSVTGSPMAGQTASDITQTGLGYVGGKIASPVNWLVTDVGYGVGGIWKQMSFADKATTTGLVGNLLLGNPVHIPAIVSEVGLGGEGILHGRDLINMTKESWNERQQLIKDFPELYPNSLQPLVNTLPTVGGIVGAGVQQQGQQ